MFMKRFWGIALLFFLFCGGVMAQEEGWKVVDTEINSFEVPSDWINSFYEEPGNEYKKKVSEKYGFRSWIIAWRKKTLEAKLKSWDEFQEVTVSVMSKLDGKKLDWKTMKKLRGTSEKPATKQLFETENEICYKCVYDSEDMNGKVYNWTNVIYYREVNNQVHRIEFSTTTRNFKKIKGLEADVMRIFKSLKVKENDMSK